MLLQQIRKTGKWSDTSDNKIPEILSPLAELAIMLSINVDLSTVKCVGLVISGKKD